MTTAINNTSTDLDLLVASITGEVIIKYTNDFINFTETPDKKRKYYVALFNGSHTDSDLDDETDATQYLYFNEQGAGFYDEFELMDTIKKAQKRANKRNNNN